MKFKETYLWILGFLLGIIPFIVPFALGIYRMSIEHWELFDWLVLYSFIYWPTYFAGFLLMIISLIGFVKFRE
ncbi:MAG: hypothetical protein IKY81_00195 [Methanocorpusculum sp.]|nr:hypothetical protein [Methanocorpusculum sp.]